jgi:hypothetical protein
MDMDKLNIELSRCRDERTPVIAVISAFGTTEEGAVDNHDAILGLRKQFSIGENPLCFYWHCDAAYGGYALSILHSPSGFSQSDKLLSEIEDHLLESRRSWPVERRDRLISSLRKWRREYGKSAAAIRQTDSVTIDPHKWGYVPYPCGAIIFRRSEVRDLTSVHAPYVFHRGGAEETKFIGRYILEGSKPGAAAAACWLGHRMLPLNQEGYGKLVAQTIHGAKELYWRLRELSSEEFVLAPLNRQDPDLNIVCFAINQAGNSRLRVMNAINQLIYETLSPTHAFEQHLPVGIQPFFVSKTDLGFEAYRGPSDRDLTALDGFLKNLGISEGQLRPSKDPEVQKWVADSRVIVVRCTVMGPWLLEEAQRTGGKTYLDLFLDTLRGLLNSADFLNRIELRKTLLELESKLAFREKRVVMLFADDRPKETKDIRHFLKNLLGDRVEIREANSPLEAMEKLRDLEIELAVLDVDFPNNRLGGVKSIFSYIRQERGNMRDRSIPCLLYTHFDERDQEYQEAKSLIVEIGPGKYSLLSKRDYAPQVVVRRICSLLTNRLEEARES